MNWQKIRVHRYTRELHPEDHKEGLPSPGELDEDPNNYEEWHVRQNQSGDWVGRNEIINGWLLTDGDIPASTTYVESKEIVYAKDKQAKPARLYSKKKTAGQSRRKR